MKFIRILFVFLFISMPMVQAKVLVVVASNYYQYDQAGSHRIQKYITDVNSYDSKKTLIFNFTNPTGTMYQKCNALWNVIRDQYVTNHHTIATADDIEGVVLIGNLPEPMFDNGATIPLLRLPVDYYYMDVFNQLTQTKYNNDSDIWTYNSVDDVFSISYNSTNGDSKADIWISHIFGHRITNIRKGQTIQGEYSIVDDYLDRLHFRMTEPSTVPNRGMAFGGLTEYASNYDVANTLHLYELPLKQYFEFRHPNNSPTNLQAQLQAGPLGNVNYGACNGLRFPAERNQTNCIQSSLTDPRTNIVYNNLDQNGYEWIGIFEHSWPEGHTLNASHLSVNTGANGNFFNTYRGPFWGNNQLVSSTSAVNGSYYTVPVPHGTYKTISWRAKIPTAGTYDIYMSYVPSSGNTTNLPVQVIELPLNNFGASTFLGKTVIDQTKHTNTQNGNTNWEWVGKYVFNNANDSAWVLVDFNGIASSISGNVYADAIKLVNSSIPEIIVDNTASSFVFSDWKDRAFEDMQDEDITSHASYSKALFFLTNACEISDYTFPYGDCLGVLYGLTHNGLISIGTTDLNYANQNYSPFVNSVKSLNNLGYPKDFGESFLSLIDSYGIFSTYTLMGAGNLSTKAYIPFGTTIFQNLVVTTTLSNSASAPVLVRNTTVEAGASYSTSSSGTDKQIIIRPETAFKQGSYVHLYLN